MIYVIVFFFTISFNVWSMDKVVLSEEYPPQENYSFYKHNFKSAITWYLINCLFAHFPAWLQNVIQKYHYNELLNDDTSLAEDLPLSPYWQSLKNKSQEEKNNALSKAVYDLKAFENIYPLRRRNVYDAMRIGANPNIDAIYYSFLKQTIRHDDSSLLQMLINHGLNTNITFLTNNPPIYYARSEPVAELLVNNGANLNYKNGLRENLLFRAMNPGCKNELIRFYLKKGVSPFEYNKFGNSPLHELAIYSYKAYALQKASFLLEHVTTQEIVEQIGRASCRERV